ncbi:MAG: (deoxy)nucleoside triphosphate pyrophosphohydrolase [Clostridiaceae bacterium]|nr:(deoxy)nucleoside triphosphate pyrophosphohydrolase [Clostridiaceae bacterium]
MKQIEVVAAIIVFDGQILCMQRGYAEQEYISYKFEFPGGKIEAGETKTEALRRELWEEMNLQVEITYEDFFMTVNHSYPDFDLTMHSYVCHVESKEFVCKEHIDFKWLYPEELNCVDWAAADYPIVEKLMVMSLC